MKFNANKTRIPENEENLRGFVDLLLCRPGRLTFSFFRSILVLAILLLSLNNGSACTVPVFRYALDQWRGKSEPAVQDSPHVEDIAKRILSGDSAVWIQVDSGNQEADDASFELLTTRLKFFESVAELPEIDPNDPSSQLGPGPPLTLRFSALRLPRSDSFTKMLIGPKADSLPEDEAWIAPIFGRGRVLGIWQASLMDEEGIDEACFYLTGACSCQVKVQNPGWDLIMNVAWDERLHLAESEEPEQSEPVETEPPSPESPEEVTFTPLVRPRISDINLLPFLGIGLLIGGVVLLMKSRKPKA